MLLSNSFISRPVRRLTHGLCKGATSSPNRPKVGVQNRANRVQMPQSESYRIQPVRAVEKGSPCMGACGGATLSSESGSRHPEAL